MIRGLTFRKEPILTKSSYWGTIWPIGSLKSSDKMGKKGYVQNYGEKGLRIKRKCDKTYEEEVTKHLQYRICRIFWSKLLLTIGGSGPGNFIGRLLKVWSHESPYLTGGTI
ncbi:MAG: hypothetical protein QW478_07135 [Candidatus Micrarchaeaceae archaeon]